MNNNISANIINGTTKNGQPYKAVQFSIMTSQGEYKSPLCFPTSLEMSLVEKALSPMQAVYGDTSPKTDGVF